MDTIQTEAFAARAHELMSRWHVPGLSIAVFNREDVSAKGFGLAVMDPPVAASAETIYDMASTSKSFTAASIGKLIDEEKTNPPIHWDSKMSVLLHEEFVLSDPFATQGATVEDVLSHQTGLPRHESSYLSIDARVPDTPRSVTTNLRNLAMTAPLRTKHQYCNIMYTVASYLVEKYSQEKLAEFLQSNFFDLLGMKSSFLQPSAVYAAGQQDRLSVPYTWREKSETYLQLQREEQPEAQGAGSIQSTVLDYSKWVRAMMKRDKSLFSDDIYKELFRPRNIANPDDSDEKCGPFFSHTMYALGWETRFYRGYRIIGHDGSISGHNSVMLFIPRFDSGLVICANADGGEDLCTALAYELVDDILNIPVPERVDWAEESDKSKEDEEDQEASLEKIKQEYCPDGIQRLKLPLDTFVGTYNNAGYHDLVVEIKNDGLYVDATDRSAKMVISLEHAAEDKLFIATCNDGETDDVWYMRAQFRFAQDGKITSFGIEISEIPGNVLTWFDKVSG